MTTSPKMLKEKSQMPSSELTVLMATHEVNQWLRDAIDSVFASEGVRFNFVLVFDGVPREQIQEFTSDKRITCLVLEKNMGTGGALHAGMNTVKTEFVARIDSDDLVTTDRLAKQLEFLKSHLGVVLVSCQMTIIDEDSKVTGQTQLPHGLDIRTELLESNVVCAGGSVYRRSAYKKAGGFDASLRKFEDYDLWLRMARQGPISILNEHLYLYRVSSNSLSTTFRPWETYLRVVLRQKKKLAAFLNVDSRTVRKATLGWCYWQWRAYFDKKRARAAMNAPEWVRNLARRLARN
jgi:cellulose synthase/poly-beta-1,6-N-acetylglucosamine synthase-like glycosyltransferase